MDRETFKDDLACNVTLIAVLLATVIYLLILTLNLFHVSHIDFHENFNYITAYIFVIACLALYIFGFFTYRLTNIYMPSWFRIMFYIAFFIFTNIYYVCNLFNSMLGLVFFFAYISFLVCIISLSIYFNTQKDEKNKLKIQSKSLIASVFFYSVAANAILQFVINFIKVIAFEGHKFSNLSAYLIEFGTMLGVSAIVAIIFALSLAGTKTLINACLIKVNNR